MTACSVAFEHGQSLRILLEVGNPTSAVSLQRLQFEALTRAMWLLYAASDTDVAKLLAPLSADAEKAANHLPLVGEMVETIKKGAPAAAYEMLASFKDVTWRAMNSFVHIGIHPLQRHGEGYPLPLILQIVQNSNALATMTAMLLAILTGEQERVAAVRGLQLEFKDCLPSLSAIIQEPR